MTSAITSFQGDRYQVLSKLGEGGKGIVFLCQDTTLARRVAIKAIKEEALDTDGLLRFQREVQAMASLVHPNVVTVFDIGQEGGRHFLVLELMEGGDVEHRIATSLNKRLDAASTVRIGRQVARALEHAHACGILHRDVKPGNIWLTKSGQAKLGDFGLAYLGSSPRLTHPGMMVGSVAYMAPEVALGRQADARSDLYMLGASLYEMATGRVPFPGEDPVRVLFSHINDVPLPPRRFAPDIPEGLEAIVLRLLSKDPEQRPASAAEVQRTLEEVERSIQGAAGSGGALLPTPTPSPGPRPPTPEPRFFQPLVGREQEIAFLRQRVDAALRGEGSLVLLSGEAGIGKSRLAAEVRPYARGRGFLWLEGRYVKEGNFPFQAWVEAVRSYLRIAKPATLTNVLLPHGAELARLVPEVAERLGWMPSPPAIGPQEERTRLYAALAGFFNGIAREQPLVLFLDDLQWALDIDTLHHLARTTATERLLVIGAYGDTELEEKPALSRTVLAMNRQRLFHPLPLKRLGSSEVARMVSQTLGAQVSVMLGEMVYQKTEGNPFFVEEVLRSLTESGAITLGEKGWEVRRTALVELPRSVKAVVGERLERLDDETRGVLGWASVVGREFSLSLLKAITGLEEEKLLDIVDNAVAARVLTARPSLGQETYAFVDNQTEEVLYGMIGPARRRRYHLKAGQAVEKVHSRRLEEHYDALARHFLEGNDLLKAAEYTVKAGDRASSIYAWERAIVRYRNALELLEELEADSRQQGEVLEKLGHVTALGRGRDAVGHWEKALSLYEALGDGKKAGEIHLRLAQQYRLYEVAGQDWGKAYSHSLKALALMEAEGESPELARTYARLGFYAALNPHQPMYEAITRSKAALALAERLGDDAAAAEAARLSGYVLVFAGEVERGLELLRQSIESARKRDDSIAVGEAANLLSNWYATLRDAAAARRSAEQFEYAARRSNTFRHQVASALFLAWASILLGDAPRALSSLELAEGMARDGGVEIGQAGGPAIIIPALVHFSLGDWSKAETELISCAAVGKQAPNLPLELFAAAALGQLYLEQRELSSAKKYLRDAIDICRTKAPKPHELLLHALLVEVTCKDRELEEAVAHMRHATEMFSLSADWRGLAGEVHLAEGMLAAAQDRPLEAEAAFQRAVDVNRQHHLPYYEARSLLEWGEMYLSRGGHGAASSARTGQDREKGMQLLDQSLAIFQRVQAKKMVEKVLARKELLKA